MGFLFSGKMKCENPICKKEINLAFKIKGGVCVCENCALLSGMDKNEIEKIKEEARNN